MIWQGISHNHCSLVWLFVPKLRPLVAADELLPCSAVATPITIPLILLSMVLNIQPCLPNVLLEYVKIKLPH